MTDRSAYQEKMQAKLDEWRAELDKLSAIANQKKADAGIEYQNQLKSLEERYESAAGQLDDLKQSGDQAWQEIRSGMEDAWASLGDALQ